MKKIEVIVKDRNTLVLNEDASKGDYIDLSDLSNVDFSQIEESIKKGQDKVYNDELTKFKQSLEASHNLSLAELKAKNEQEKQQLKNQLDKIKNELETNYIKEKSELIIKHTQDIQKLNNEITNLKNNEKQAIELEKNKLTLNYQTEIAGLKEKITKLTSESEIELLKYKQKVEQELNELKNKHQEELREKDERYNLLQRQKAALNVKQTGEDLEVWCDNEVKSYMQNGLSNCVWHKDNEVVREDGETKGSKADFIFEVYASNNHAEQELLTSVCLEMKDENPDSSNKHKNADHYNTLNKNRLKKNCKYALLVSNLEMDKPNDLPIYKVNEYDDMYVVRPAYLMTFLNMIASLTTRFAHLVLADKQQNLELLNVHEYQEKFEDLKQKYLDKPLISLKSTIEAIKDQNETILKASRKIDENCDKITRNYINEIEEKLRKFTDGLDKATRKYEKNNND